MDTTQTTPAPRPSVDALVFDAYGTLFDVQALIAQWHRAIAVDGFLMFSCLGPDTVRELHALYRDDDHLLRPLTNLPNLLLTLQPYIDYLKAPYDLTLNTSRYTQHPYQLLHLHFAGYSNQCVRRLYDQKS